MDGLKTARYSHQFGVNPEIAAALVAACAERCDVEFVASIHLLNVSSNECSSGMAIGGTTMGSLFTRLVFPVFQPRGLTHRGL